MKWKEASCKKISILALLVLFLLSGFWIWRMSLLNFDYDFEKFFPVNDPETAYFQKHRQQFETDNDFVLVAPVNEKGIFDRAFLKEVAALTDALKAVPDVVEVISPTDSKYRIIDPFTGFPVSVPYLHPDDPSRYVSDSIHIWSSPDLIGNQYSEDGKSVAILIKHQPYLSKTGCDTLAANIFRQLEARNFDDCHTAGRSIGQSYYVQLMQNEFGFFFITSFFLVVVFLFLAFRSVWGILVPLLVVILTVIWILGVMNITGKSVDIMLTILPTIMFVVGMSDVVHIMSKYIEELRNGKTKLKAIGVAFREVGTATFLTSLTTAVGFFTLLSSNVIPIMDFGIYAGIGVFIAFILAFGLLPPLMVLTKKPEIADRKSKNGAFWARRLHTLLRWTLSHRPAVWIGTGALLVVCGVGISKIERNNFLLDDLDGDDPLTQEFAFFGDQYGGARPFELALSVKDSSATMLDYDVLLLMDTLEKWLPQQMDAAPMISPLTAVKSMNRMLHGGNNAFFTLPTDRERYNRLLLPRLKKGMAGEKARVFITPDLKKIRMTSRMSDIGSVEVRKRNKALETFMSENGFADVLDWKLTGTARLIDINNAYLAENMLLGLVIAFGVIALIIGILFKSVKMVIVSLIPNVMPLLVTAGIMGFFGIPLKTSTSIIFTLVFGIAVDDTIHFLSKLRLESLKGKPLFYAIKQTYFSTGKAIVVTSVILCGGFLTLVFSDFMGTFYIGVLISVALLTAVMADLVLLPLLLIAFYRKNVPIIPKRNKNE